MFIDLCTVDIVSTLYYIHLYKALLHWCPKSGFPDIGVGTTILSYRVQTCFLVREKVGRGQRWEKVSLHVLFVCFVTFGLDLVEHIIMRMSGVLKTKKVQNQSNKDTLLYY